MKPHVNPNVEIKKVIVERYRKENPFVSGVVRLLINSIDLFRKTNFNSWNIKPVEKNFLGIELTSCKISRFIKYLIYEFALTILIHFRKKYEEYLEENIEERLC